MELRKLDAAKVDITAESVERAKRTGHPRLLASVISGTPAKALTEVHIEGLTFSTWEGYSEWTA